MKRIGQGVLTREAEVIKLIAEGKADDANHLGRMTAKDRNLRGIVMIIEQNKNLVRD